MSIQASLFRLVARWVAISTDSDTPLEEKRRQAAFGGWLVRPPRGTQVRPVMIGKIPARWIKPARRDPQRVILYLHGGGWVYGLIPTYNMLIGQIARDACATALAIDYRLAPEHPFPAALEDCLAAYRYLLDQGHPPEKIVIMGDSAGGNLTLTTLLAARQAGLPLPAAGVCLSPATDFAERGESFRTNLHKDAILSVNFVDFASLAYLAGHDKRDPLVSPVYADLHGLPPLLIQAGGDELLLSDVQKFAGLASQAGVRVTLRVYPGMWHVWQGFCHYLPEARSAISEIGRFVQEQA